jgi:endonuclease/exonuclease/phosphatase (EEP) superfamily protein YafD
MTAVSSVRRGLVDAVLWAIAAAGAAVALCVSLARLSYVVDFFAQAAGPLLSVSILATVAALALRRWAPFAGLLVASAVLAIALRGQWFLSNPRPAPGAEPTRIYFSNIWRKNRRPDEAARSIATAGADVLAIAEAPDYLAGQPRLFAAYPYQTNSAPDCAYENCPRDLIASRWPIERLPAFYTGGFGVVAARIYAPSGPFRLVVVHLTRPWPFAPERFIRRQLGYLAQAINQDRSEPLVVVGDFNATLSGFLLRDLIAKTGLSPSRARLGDWPSNIPGPFRVAIENAFAGDGEMITSRRLGRPNGSDHRPIIIEVARTQPQTRR